MTRIDIIDSDLRRLRRDFGKYKDDFQKLNMRVFGGFLGRYAKAGVISDIRPQIYPGSSNETGRLERSFELKDNSLLLFMDYSPTLISGEVKYFRNVGINGKDLLKKGDLLRILYFLSERAGIDMDLDSVDSCVFGRNISFKKTYSSSEVEKIGELLLEWDELINKWEVR